MFSETQRKRMPHFVRYVERRAPEVAQNDAVRILTGCALGPLALLGIGFALGQVMSTLIAVLMTLLVGTPVVLVTLAMLLGKVGRPRTAEDKRRHDVHHTLEIVGNSIERKRLHRELDPTAAQLWEAAAYYWLSIRDTLDGRWWTEAKGQYAALREQSRRAADETMDEILLLGATCIGKPDRERKDDLKEAVEDLVELDIAEALEGFRRVATADKRAYVHKSPHIEAVFPTMRELAEKLKLMSGELTELTQKSLAQSATELAGGVGTSSIDLVLTELRAVRQAESELAEDQRLGF